MRLDILNESDEVRRRRQRDHILGDTGGYERTFRDNLRMGNLSDYHIRLGVLLNSPEIMQLMRSRDDGIAKWAVNTNRTYWEDNGMTREHPNDVRPAEWVNALVVSASRQAFIASFRELFDADINNSTSGYPDNPVRNYFNRLLDDTCNPNMLRNATTELVHMAIARYGWKRALGVFRRHLLPEISNW